MSTKQRNDAALARGAEAIRKAEQEQPSLRVAGKEVSRLHREILAAAGSALVKAIRVGELLHEAKAQIQHGGWATWLRGSVNFSERTAQRYMACFERRVQLKRTGVSDLSAAYAVLCLPMRGKSAMRFLPQAKTTIVSDLPSDNDSKPERETVYNDALKTLVEKGICTDGKAARRLLRERQEREGQAEAAPMPVVEQPRHDNTTRGWTPEPLEETDLTPAELALVKSIRAHLADTSALRCRIFLRFLRERLECGSE
jgi:hypothetical protein